MLLALVTLVYKLYVVFSLGSRIRGGALPPP
jgi:hypothetical protein